jgi:hypothetical protein
MMELWSLLYFDKPSFSTPLAFSAKARTVLPKSRITLLIYESRRSTGSFDCAPPPACTSDGASLPMTPLYRPLKRCHLGGHPHGRTLSCACNLLLHLQQKVAIEGVHPRTKNHAPVLKILRMTRQKK